MKILLSQLRSFVKNCDPATPLTADSELYEPLDDDATPVRGSGGQSCLDVLYQTIVRDVGDGGSSCQLFTGFPGTGKTTELRRLEKRFKDSSSEGGTCAIYIDFGQYISLFTPPSIADILRIFAYCLDRAAALAEGSPIDAQDGYLGRFYDLLSGYDVIPKGESFASFGSSIMLEIKNNPIFRCKVEEALAQRFQHFADECQRIISSSVVRLRAAKSDINRVVVIADSLEKFAPMRDEDRQKMESSIETVFVQHASFMRLQGCHVIYTFPLWLRYRNPSLGACYDQEPQVLPMVKVINRDGSIFAPGVCKLKSLLGRRINLETVFGKDGDTPIETLIKASGGYPRDLLRMVRTLLTTSDDFPVRPAAVAQTITRLSEEYGLAVRKSYLPLLDEIKKKKEMPHCTTETLALFGELISKWLVLSYRNGESWYDLHPLVDLALNPMAKNQSDAKQQ